MDDYLALMLVTGFFGVWFGTWISRGVRHGRSKWIVFFTLIFLVVNTIWWLAK